MSYFDTHPTTSLPIACTIAFPPLQTLFINNHHHNKSHTTVSNECPPPLLNAITPPKYPLYLKYTGYADLVLQQYHDRKAKLLTTLINNDYRLPQFWNKRQQNNNNNNNHVHIGLNGYDLTVNNNNNNVITTLQTNVPIPPQCGIYYFEIRVIQKGLDGNFAIGFSSRKNHKLNKLPGCDAYSFGYHGYDGKVYQHDTKGTSYGPTFISGDIIGCCINYATQSAFFTKNGISLGIAFESINTTELLYPCIGLSTPGEKITTNFGQIPFLFDIVHYIQSLQKTLLINTCQQYKKDDIKADIDQLVISYLIEQGYTDTATTLLNNIQYVKQLDYSKNVTIQEDDYIRNKIRKLIMTGYIDTAIEHIHSFYPGLLNQSPDILFQLKTRKFLDIFIMNDTTTNYNNSSSSSSSDDTDDDTLSTYSSRSRTQSFSGYHDLHHQILYEEEEEQEQENKPCSFGHVNATPLSVAASGRRLSWAAIAAPSSSSIDTMSEDIMYTTTTRRKSFSSNSSSSRIRRDSFDFLEEEQDMKRMSMVRKAMNYGHQLQEEYQHQSKYFNKLLELFTLFDYSDPTSSPLSYLLDISLRDQVASQLNTAIHKYKNHAENSALELIYKQSVTIQKELIYSGHGKASFMNINHYFVEK